MNAFQRLKSLGGRKMNSNRNVVLGLILVVLAAGNSPAQTPKQSPRPKLPGRLPTTTTAAAATSAPAAVAFLVNGFAGCCIPKRVKEFLELQPGVKVYEANWNDLERRRDPGHFTEVDQIVYNTDEYFIKQMQEKIASYPESTRIILIGHSFGGDSVLQVAKRIGGRRIAFLGVLDPVGRAGLRKNVTKPVPSNVEYFFNRWQENSPLLPSDVKGRKLLPQMLPLDSNFSGKLSAHAPTVSDQGKQNTEKSSKCKTKYRDPLKALPQLLEHSEVPKDGCIQEKMIGILKARVFN